MSVLEVSTSEGSSYRQWHLCNHTQWSLGHESPETMKDVLSCTSLPVLGHACGLHYLQKEQGAVHGWRCPRWRHLRSRREALLLVWDSCMALFAAPPVQHQTMLLDEMFPNAFEEATGRCAVCLPCALL